MTPTPSRHTPLLVTALLACLAAPAAAQEPCPPCPEPAPEPPPPIWTGSLGGGLSLTGGNTETNSYNLSFDIKRDATKADPNARGIFRTDGLYLRTDTDGEATADRSALGARYEHTLGGGRGFGFGEVRYQRDRFKDVDYLITPGVGLGLRLVDTGGIYFAVDAGVGLAFEKLRRQDATTSGAVNAGQALRFKLSESASILQNARVVWKMSDFGDAYYHFDAGLALKIVKRIELQLTFADDYKTRPPDDLKKNDTSFLTTIAFKI